MLLFGKRIQVPLVGLVLFGLLFARAWTRLLYPEVWDEDGTRNIPGFIALGIRDLVEPVNGFLIVVPKLITWSGLSISITRYPVISTVLAWGVILAILFMIATARVRLAGGLFLAIACIWVPSDPEVFGLPLYTFWWSSLVLFLLVFWKEDSTAWGWRAALLVLASLSGPVCVLVFPLFWLRAWLFRANPAELRLAVVATVSSAAQLWVMSGQNAKHSVVSGAAHLDIAAVPQIVPKFLGAYAVGNLWPQWQTPAGLVVLIVMGLTLYHHRRAWWMWAVAYLWLGSVMISISRVDIRMIHPVTAGPRYFFFPFIILSWWLIQTAFGANNRWLRLAGGMILGWAVVNTFPVLYRVHDRLHWQTHLLSCRDFPQYTIPVQFDGKADRAWKLPLTGRQCSKLVAADWFYPAEGPRTLPYRVVGKAREGVAASKLPGSSAVIHSDWRGKDYYSVVSGMSTLPKAQVLGSFLASSAESGSLSLKLKRGDQVWFRSEIRSRKQRIEVVGGDCKFLQLLPDSSEWALLEFSSGRLPDEFTVSFVDGGGGWGEWSAIGLSAN